MVLRGYAVVIGIATAMIALVVWLVIPSPPAQAGPLLLSVNRSVQTSSSAGSSLVGANAVDGRQTTRWASAKEPGPQWITVDLGDHATISRVRLDWDAAYGSAYEIQMSEDATNWSTVAALTGGDGRVDEHAGLSASGRYVRIYVTSGKMPDGFSLTEVEVFGFGGGPVPVSKPRGEGASVWAGVRSSAYGIRGSAKIPFPSPQQWESAMKTMSGYLPGSTPTATIWLVGDVDFSTRGMVMEFPKPDDGRTYGPLYQFRGTDKHEPYLDYFDSHDIGVYLQLEPGDADIPTLIDLVLNRYSGHPSVLGLAIDAEWINKTSLSDTDTPVTDAQAQDWERRVKGHSDSYRLVLKHFNEANLPPTYRGDIIFVCDSERNHSYQSFLAEMKRFAGRFYPNDVMFQVGYPSDRVWWSHLPAPIPQTIGRDLSAQTRQNHGVLWVDFSIDDPLINLIPN